MLKKLVTFMILSGLVASVGCTSGKKEGEEADDVAAVEAEGLEGDEAADAKADEFGADEGLLESGEEVVADLGAEEPPGGDEFSGSEGLDEGADAAKTPSGGQDLAGGGDPLADDPMATEPAPTEDSTISSTPPISEPGGGLSSGPTFGADETIVPDDTPKPKVSLKKIAETPYKTNGILVNAVYIARPGDTLTSVSMKIFGRNNKKELLKANPHLSRGLKVGDKVYYNSPQRPTDSERILTFYEDAGLAPETYTAQAGENIREVAKRLLGDANSWKEIWATNLDVESKGELPEGTRLRYWGSTDIAAAPVSQPPADLPPGPTGDDLDSPPPLATDGTDPMAAPPPPPAADIAANDIPPPPTDDLGAPPPPPAAATTEPPPPPPPAATPPRAAPAPSIEDPDQTMALAAGLVLLVAGLALVIIIRKKKSRRGIDFNTSTQTQIE